MMKSFAEVYPELLPEWAEENEYMAEKISYGSNKMIIWNGLCGHTWAATAKNRGNGSGCPFCSGNKVLRGYNDLETLFPELSQEWSDMNLVQPYEVTKRANRYAWWKCNKCGCEWKARIADRTDGHGCPVCAGEKLVSGINDFATEYPMIAAEWSDRNVKKPSEVWTKSRENVWWKCGYEWKAVIDSRVKGSRCPHCSKRERQELIPYRTAEEERRFKIQAIAYYADDAGSCIIADSDDIIGVMLDTYFPEQKAAIIFSNSLQRECLVRRERAKNWLCLNAGIKLFRILPPNANEYDNCVCVSLADNSLEVLGFALQTIFEMIRLPADIDIVRDIGKIKQKSI